MRILNLFLIMFLSLGILGIFGTIDSPVTTTAAAGEHQEKSDSDTDKDKKMDKKEDSKDASDKDPKKEGGK